MELERNMGEQPIIGVMAELELKANDLVTASTEHITHKMVSRARKGRRLTPNVKNKIINAMNKAAGKEFTGKDLFTY